MTISTTLRDKPVDREQASHTGSDKDISSNQDSNVFDRPFTESATAWDSTIDDGFLADEESPNFEHMVQLRTVADNVNRTVRNRNNTRGRWSWPGSENDISSDENSNLFNQPVTESATARTGIETNSFSVEHVKSCEIPVTELVTVRVSDTEEPLVMRVSTITTELSELGTSACSETDISDIPAINLAKQCYCNHFVCLSVCLFVCLSVCLSVFCVSAVLIYIHMHGRIHGTLHGT